MQGQAEERVHDELQKLVNSKQTVAHHVRRMPDVMPKLLQSLRLDNYSCTDIAKRISHDPSLVAAVVKVADSSQYSKHDSITSIKHAVLMIGHEGLRQLITSVALQPIINKESGCFTQQVAPRLWLQSQKCAAANRALAINKDVDHFAAFLAGLVQNIGLTVALRAADRVLTHGQHIGSEAFYQQFAERSLVLSTRIASEWNFPEEVIRAIEEQIDPHLLATQSTLGKILAIGNVLSKMQILMQYDQLSAESAALLSQLAPHELSCLHELQEVETHSM